MSPDPGLAAIGGAHTNIGCPCLPQIFSALSYGEKKLGVDNAHCIIVLSTDLPQKTPAAHGLDCRLDSGELSVFDDQNLQYVVGQNWQGFLCARVSSYVVLRQSERLPQVQPPMIPLTFLSVSPRVSSETLHWNMAMTAANRGISMKEVLVLMTTRAAWRL